MLCDLLDPEDVKVLKESIDKAGNGEPAKKELVGKVVGLGEKAEGKFMQFA